MLHLAPAHAPHTRRAPRATAAAPKKAVKRKNALRAHNGAPPAKAAKPVHCYTVAHLRHLAQSPAAQRTTGVPVGPWSPAAERARAASSSTTEKRVVRRRIEHSANDSEVKDLRSLFEAAAKSTKETKTTSWLDEIATSPRAPLSKARSTRSRPQLDAPPSIPRPKSAPIPIRERREVPLSTVAKRQKQVDFGKESLSYKMYMVLRSDKAARLPSDPRTPPTKQPCSKRSWIGQISRWRRELHKFDPETPQEWHVARQLFPEEAAWSEAKERERRGKEASASSTDEDTDTDTDAKDDGCVELICGENQHNTTSKLKSLKAAAVTSSEYVPLTQN